MKALDEIYKIDILLHRSDIEISARMRATFFRFLRIQNEFFKNSFNNIVIFMLNIDEVLSEFR